ncbi:MAG: Smr/MutS family protein, partial [Paludibacteraceae bacterium]
PSVGGVGGGLEGRGESVFRDFAALRHLTLTDESPARLPKEKPAKPLGTQASRLRSLNSPAQHSGSLQATRSGVNFAGRGAGGGASFGTQASRPQANSTINYQLKRKADFTPYLDLRGMRVDEALETFIRFMDDAVMVNAGEVTVLHGTGTGALKQLVRDYLNGQNAHRAKYHRSLFTFRDGDPDRGGAGITIINV